VDNFIYVYVIIVIGPYYICVTCVTYALITWNKR